MRHNGNLSTKVRGLHSALKPPPGTATPSADTHPPPASTELTCSPRSRTPSPETPGYHPSRPSPELHPELITHSYTCVTGTPECLRPEAGDHTVHLSSYQGQTDRQCSS